MDSIFCAWRSSVVSMGVILGGLVLSGRFCEFLVVVEEICGFFGRFGGFLCVGMGGCVGILKIFMIFMVFLLNVIVFRSVNFHPSCYFH